MGNWRRVQTIGTCDRSEVGALREACLYDLHYPSPGFDFHCLSYAQPSGLCGLGAWPQERIEAVGNLAERDYSPESVARALRKLVKVAPSLRLKVHCGDDYERDECIATVAVEGGEVVLGPPEIETVPEQDPLIGQRRLMQHLLRPGA